MERMALRTPFTEVVRRATEIVRHPALEGRARLVVDATGLGAPVVEMLRAANRSVGAAGLTAVTITGGEKAHGGGENWHVPKRDLMGGLQVLLEQGMLRIHGKLKEAPALVRELREIRMWHSEAGHVAMGAGSGEHDDLAMAVALGCWKAQRATIGFGQGPLF